ncbi:MAG TPA: arginine--tRNA ligase [Syntrophorhabdaceae bacterium]|nr:arginine--tRNA ligase [Syntrophorhabdaceae bacterium]
MIRNKLAEIIREACRECEASAILPAGSCVNPLIEVPREEGHGDYATNVAFALARTAKKNPLEIANLLVLHLKAETLCRKVEIAGKGFINFYLKDDVWRTLLSEISLQGIEQLYPDVGNGRKVLIEFVSANPTGPLHIGHGRGAAVGDVLANLLELTGYETTREYYINDAGRQIRTLGESTYLRWKQIRGENIDFPKDCYQGDYVKELAQQLIDGGVAIPDNKDQAVSIMSQYSGSQILKGIQKDLDDFGVTFDNYFNESTLFEKGVVENTLDLLKSEGYAYEKDGALWFTTSKFEKDEDRVLIKSGGEKTYFTSDIAYHMDKFIRSFDLLIDIWGSDHHGYIPRLRASIQALGKDKESFRPILIQFVTLLKDGKPVGMSTRSGEFTTLQEVVQEVGRDAARFFFLTRKSDSHLEFDLDLAKKTSNENPVYYVQYAHARICSIFRNAAEAGIDSDAISRANVELLTMPEEISLMKGILGLYQMLEGSARNLEPHRITFYLMDLVGRFHSYYNKARVLGDDGNLTLARLWLLDFLKKVIKTCLDLLGVSAPERM